jgi:hypothetical protein
MSGAAVLEFVLYLLKNDCVGVRVAFFGEGLPMDAASPEERPLAGIRFTKL